MRNPKLKQKILDLIGKEILSDIPPEYKECKSGHGGDDVDNFLYEFSDKFFEVPPVIISDFWFENDEENTEHTSFLIFYNYKLQNYFISVFDGKYIQKDRDKITFSVKTHEINIDKFIDNKIVSIKAVDLIKNILMNYLR